jgi:long-chain acyl-CoA synthetase
MKFVTETEGPPITERPSDAWIFDRIEEWARRDPNRFAFAVDHRDRVETYGYADVLKEAEAVAVGLKARGIHPGERIGILMENIPHWIFVLLGAMRMSAVTVPMATTLPESALRRIVEHARCRLIFADAPNLAMACAVASAGPAEVVSLSDSQGCAIPWNQFQIQTSNIDNPAQIDGESIILLIYTSGTTGEPKGVQLSMLNLAFEIHGVAESLSISSEHRILSVLPFSHVLPLVANGLGPLCLGAGVVFLSSISPQRIIDAFHRHHITLFICVPQFFYALHKKIFSQVAAQNWTARALFRLMLSLSRRIQNAKIRRKLFARIHSAIGPDLRLLASGGSRFDDRVARDLSDLGYIMLQAYGLTETAAAATATPQNDNRIGTVGKPVRGVQIRIDSPNEEGVGEVWIRGPIVMKGYYKDADQTAQVLRDGWLHTGDLGLILPDGNLVLTGRSKDVIVLPSGKNVYPEEVEIVYAQSPFISDICIIGVPDNGSEPADEKLRAIVVPDFEEFRRRGQTAILETIRFEMENLSKQLSSFQRVHSLSIRNEPLPRTVTRKLKRFEIQEQELRRESQTRPAHGQDHPKLLTGTGALVAALVRAARPNAGPLDPSLNIELDLGLDSLSRVELLGELETRLGVHIEGEEAARIYTIGELIDALERHSAGPSVPGRGWREILGQLTPGQLPGNAIFKPKPFASFAIVALSRLLRLLLHLFFGLSYSGLQKLPKSPFLVCPNHESFLDAPLLYALLPAKVIRNIFSLGYSEYWEGSVSRWIAEKCNIVSIDPNVNLVRAMQIGAAGLNAGKVLLVFPEGSRSIDGRIAEFKKGAAILAIELGIPILPVGISGTFEVWPRGGGVRFHPVSVAVGDPIDPARFVDAADPYRTLTEHLRDAVKRLAGQ